MTTQSIVVRRLDQRSKLRRLLFVIDLCSEQIRHTHDAVVRRRLERQQLVMVRRALAVGSQIYGTRFESLLDLGIADRRLDYAAQ